MVFNIRVKMMLAWALSALLGITTMSACTSVARGADGVVRVVAAENFWGDVATQIGGSAVSVTSIVSDPNADPHEYESNTHNAAEVARADLVIENGLGYDAFIGKLMSVSSASDGKLLDIADVMSVSGKDANPHLWYDTEKLPLVADAIAAALSRTAPSDAATFTANARRFVDSLQPITHVIDEIRSRYAGTEVAYTERVPGYLLDAAQLRLGMPGSFARAVENGDDPSASDTEAFDSTLRLHKVKVLLYNSQVSDAATNRLKGLAVSSGVPVVGVSETLPTSDRNFQAWQLRQASALLAALSG